MNINEYCNKGQLKHNLLYHASIGRDGKVLTADRYFYEIMGIMRQDSIENIIHEDDVQEYREAINNMHIQPQHLILRVRNIMKEYHYYKVLAMHNGRVIDGTESYDLILMNIYFAETRAHELEVNVKKYRRYMAMMDQYYFEYDIRSNEIKLFLYVHDKNNMILRQSLDEFEKEMLLRYLPDKADRERFNVFTTYLREGVDSFNIQFSTTLLSKAGRKDVLRFSGSTFHDDDRKVMVMGIMTSRDRMQDEMAYYMTEAARDCATGLFNKRATMEYAADRIRMAARDQLAIVIIDIDNFKTINDSFGHLFGDEVISKVSDVLKSVVGSKGVVGRFGGDEFMIIMEKYGEYRQIEIVLEAVRSRMAWIYKGVNDAVNLTASIGAAKYPEDGDTYEKVFAKADTALYIAKQNGKDGYVIYNDEEHGSLKVISEDGGRHSSKANWTEAITASVLELHKYGKSSIPEVLKRVCDSAEITGVRVFYGENLENKYIEGNYKFDVDSFKSFMLEGYFEKFNENDLWVVNNVDKVSEDGEIYFAECERQNIKAFVQCAFFKQGEPFAIVSYDVQEHGYPWTIEELDMLAVTAKMIGQVLMEDMVDTMLEEHYASLGIQ